MRIKNIAFLVFTVLFLTGTQVIASSRGFETLRYLLNERSQEPKMYIPSGVVLGQDLEITILAPGAEYVKLLSAQEQGLSDYEDGKLRLAGDLNLIGQKSSERSEFKLKLDPAKYSELTGKQLFFDALAYYKDSNTGRIFSKPVLLYGANAGPSLTNGVQILSIPKDNSSLAASARSFLPGLNQRASY